MRAFLNDNQNIVLLKSSEQILFDFFLIVNQKQLSKALEANNFRIEN